MSDGGFKAKFFGGRFQRRDLKSLPRNNRFVLLEDDSDDVSYEREGDGFNVPVEDDSPQQGRGCLPRIFNRNRNRYQYQPTDRRQEMASRGGRGRNFLQRLHIVARDREGQGFSGREQADRRRNIQMSRGMAGARGPLINLVKIPQGRMFGKEFILRSLASFVEGDLKPLLFKINDTGDALFYIKDNDIANAIRTANKRISDPKSNSKMTVVVSKTPALWAPLRPQEQDLVKEVLSCRYDAENGILNLQAFGIDPAFKAGQFHGSLQRSNVMIAVVELIDQHCSQVRTIDLSNNRLRFLDYLGNLVSRAKRVQALNLADNQIEHQNELEKLKGWNLTELRLEGNPICKHLSDANAYTSAVHKVFPKVTLLDGVTVQPEIGFALDEADTTSFVTSKLPPIKPGFYVNDSLRGLVESFLVEYFKLYDGPDPENRQHLMAAYDSQALFTLTVENVGGRDSQARFSDGAVFKEYRQNSHNVLMMDKWERYRSKIVHKGSLNVVSCLCKLPKTEHLLPSFLVDISFVKDTLVCFTVQGLLRDGSNVGTDSTELRFFSRSFLVVPRGEGKIAVINELLFISALSADRAQQYMVQLKKANEATDQLVFNRI